MNLVEKRVATRKRLLTFRTTILYLEEDVTRANHTDQQRSQNRYGNSRGEDGCSPRYRGTASFSRSQGSVNCPPALGPRPRTNRNDTRLTGTCAATTTLWGRGRVWPSSPDCHSGDRGFESRRPRHFYCAPVAQLNRVPGYEPGGRGFESLWAHHGVLMGRSSAGRALGSDPRCRGFEPLRPYQSGGVAQWQSSGSWPRRQGFNPLRPFQEELMRRGAVVARRAHNPEVEGSNPSAATSLTGSASWAHCPGSICPGSSEV